MSEFSDNRPIVTITKEELAELPLAHYTAGATVIDSPDAVPEAVAHLAATRILGFDTETRPSFRKGQSYSVALLQLASPERCYLFRLNVLGLHPLLKQLLENPAQIKVGVSLHDDFHALSRLGDIKPQGFIDLQQYVKHVDIADNSLSRIYGILFGERIAKNQRLTNWEAGTLTTAQINYAAFDAVSCIRIYDHISSGRFDPSQSKYLRMAPAPTHQL